jgi:hypothetical protein
MRDTIRQAILERGYDARRGAFTQAFGSATLDATALLLPAVEFLPPTDPRVQSTVERIRTELTHDGLVYRYLGPDGLVGGEATFTFCSLWLVNTLALGGKLDDGYERFEKFVDYANDVGLLAEEIDPSTGDQIGNFPQAFSHVGLINSAVNLAIADKQGAEERPEMLAERLRRARPYDRGNEHRKRTRMARNLRQRDLAGPETANLFESEAQDAYLWSTRSRRCKSAGCSITCAGRGDAGAVGWPNRHALRDEATPVRARG